MFEVSTKLFIPFFLFVVLADIGKSASPGEFRTWNLGSAGGFYAELVEVSEDGRKVTLRGKSGNRKTGPLAKLSKEDQAYIRKLKAGGKLPVVTKPAVATTAAAEQDDVIATGTGANEKDALRNAWRNAVSQAVGALISAERRIENDELVKNQILSHSSGYVESHQMIGKPTTTESGLIEVQIRAKVQRVKLSREFERLGIQVITPGQFNAPLDGSQMADTATTKKDMQRSEEQMLNELRDQMNSRAGVLEKALQGYPENVLTAKLVGKKYDETTATMSLDIVTSIDMEKYGKFYDGLNEALKQIGGKRTTTNFRGQYSWLHWQTSYRLNLNSDTEKLLEEMPDSCIAVCRTWPIVRSTKVNQKKEFTTTWNVYQVEDAALAIVSKVTRRPIYLKIDVLDQNNSPVLSAKQMTHTGISMNRPRGKNYAEYCYDKCVFFFPAMQEWTDAGIHKQSIKHYGPPSSIGHVFNSFSPGTQEYTQTVKIDVSLEDLAEIKNISMRFEAE